MPTPGSSHRDPSLPTFRSACWRIPGEALSGAAEVALDEAPGKLACAGTGSGSAVVVGDVDGDGLGDAGLICTVGDGVDLFIIPAAMLSNGADESASRTQFPHEANTQFFLDDRAVTTADLDGDGRAELSLSTYEGYTGVATAVFSQLCEGTMTLKDAAWVVVPSAGEMRSAALFVPDVTGDGIPDLLELRMEGAQDLYVFSGADILPSWLRRDAARRRPDETAGPTASP